MVKIQPVKAFNMIKKASQSNVKNSNSLSYPMLKTSLIGASLSALALFGASMVPVSCSKEVIFEEKRSENEFVITIDGYLNSLGLLLNDNSIENVKNITFDSGEFSHILEPVQISEDLIQMKYLKLDKKI